MCTDSDDATVAVSDGAQLLLTPLGKAIVPPPMSKHKAQLSGICRYVYCWDGNTKTNKNCMRSRSSRKNEISQGSVDSTNSNDSEDEDKDENQESESHYRNGVAVLCDGEGGIPILDFFFLDSQGNPSTGSPPIRGIPLPCIRSDQDQGSSSSDSDGYAAVAVRAILVSKTADSGLRVVVLQVSLDKGVIELWGYYSLLVVSCFLLSAAFGSSDLLKSYPLISLASH